MADFFCSVCGKSFTLAEETLRKYPGWKPKYCRDHSPKKKGASPGAASPDGNHGPKRVRARGSVEAQPNLTLDEVLNRYTEGPDTGIFTDGSARPNPGPGGWGAVYVRNGKIIEQRHGHEPNTTNNRMELTALIEAYSMAPANEESIIYTDSELCLNTLTKWAKEWERNMWHRKGGPIKNLDLVKSLYKLYKNHPNTTLKWLESHSGWRWNEYADSLASAWAREEL